jgi:type IV secretory pathway TraG/TraD family ATPase VirD4
MSLRAYDDHVKGSAIEGLWIILVKEGDRQVPMLARAGNGLYLLAFRTGFTARKFVSDSRLADAEPRMVVAAQAPAVIAHMSKQGASGVLIDYDASTNTYRDAGLLN